MKSVRLTSGVRSLPSRGLSSSSCNVPLADAPAPMFLDSTTIKTGDCHLLGAP